MGGGRYACRCAVPPGPRRPASLPLPMHPHLDLQVAPTDIEEGMRVGVDRQKYQIQVGWTHTIWLAFLLVDGWVDCEKYQIQVWNLLHTWQQHGGMWQQQGEDAARGDTKWERQHGSSCNSSRSSCRRVAGRAAILAGQQGAARGMPCRPSAVSSHLPLPPGTLSLATHQLLLTQCSSLYAAPRPSYRPATDPSAAQD